MGVCTRAHHLERTGETPAQELTGSEGGEDKDEGRVGGSKRHCSKHHKHPRRRGREPGSGTERGGYIVYSSGVYRETVS